MWEIIRRLVGDGVTVFLTTRYLEEADDLVDRIAVLDHGRIFAEGTAAELKRRVPGGHIRLQSPIGGPCGPPFESSGTSPSTTRRSPSRSPAAAASGHCGRCSTGSTVRRSP